MGLRRKYLKKHLTRPSKSGSRKRRRQADQKKRLVGLGMDETVVAQMNARDVLTKLKHPKKVAAAAAASKGK